MGRWLARKDGNPVLSAEEAARHAAEEYGLPPGDVEAVDTKADVEIPSVQRAAGELLIPPSPPPTALDLLRAGLAKRSLSLEQVNELLALERNL